MTDQDMISAPIGNTGITKYGGSIDEEWHRVLAGGKDREEYREMSDNDPTVGASLCLIKNLIKQADVYIKPSDSYRQSAIDSANFVEECLVDMSTTWGQFMDDVLSMLVYGWSFFEITYKHRLGPSQDDPSKRSRYSDGKIGIRKIEIRSQHTLDEWVFDADGGLRGMRQMDIKEPIPIEKAILFRYDARLNNPQGRSILRNAWRPWRFLKRLQEMEAIGVENDATGVPSLFVPPKMLDSANEQYNASVLDAWQKRLSMFRRGEHECLILPSREINSGKTGYDFELLKSGGSRQFNTNDIIMRYRGEIANAIFFTGFLYNGQTMHGSFSLDSSQTSRTSTAIGSVLGDIVETFTRFVINPLCRYNKIDEQDWPTMEHGDIETPDIKDIADYVQKLSGAGFVMPTKQIENRLLDMIKMPHDDEIEEEIDVDDVANGDAKGSMSIDAQKSALNGAQVSSLLEVVMAHERKEISTPSATAVIMRAFNVDASEARKMLGK